MLGFPGDLSADKVPMGCAYARKPSCLIDGRKVFCMQERFPADQADTPACPPTTIQRRQYL